MTELEMGMAALGGTVVVGVLAYNKWQEARQKKLADKVIASSVRDDVLLDPQAHQHGFDAAAFDTLPGVSARNEPVLHPGASKDWATAEETGDEGRYPAHTLPVVDALAAQGTQAASLGALAAERALPDIPEELLDPRLEWIVAMDLVDPVPISQILTAQKATLQRINKPVHWVGLNEFTGTWGRLSADQEGKVRCVRAGLQLVNRLGPVSDAGLALFAGAMQALADELMAVADIPQLPVQDQAIAVDRFCAAVDLEIGVNVVARQQPFAGTKIRALAEAAGMVLGNDGLFSRFDEAGRLLFSLQNMENNAFTADNLRLLSTQGLTFLLDVPRVAQGDRVFQQMTQLAAQFADALQGVLVDDNRVPLGEPQLQHILREFVGKPQSAMVGFGIPAGSPQALRLFS